MLGWDPGKTGQSIAKSSYKVRQTCPGHEWTSKPRRISFTFLGLRWDDITLHIGGSPRVTMVLKLTVDAISLWISGQILLGTDKCPHSMGEGTSHIQGASCTEEGEDATSQATWLPVTTKNWEEPQAGVSFRTSRKKHPDRHLDLRLLMECVSLLLLSWNIARPPEHGL